MGGMKRLQADLNDEDKGLMEKLLGAGQLKHKYAVRLQTVLLRARGKGTGEIADFLGMDPASVPLHIRRYNAGGVAALLRDKTRKPGRRPVGQRVREEICRLACNEKPAGETHWSTRSLAGRAGVSHTSVAAVLRQAGLKPHLSLRRNYSTDPDFEVKLRDVVGLYMSPPENAIVLCVDEKTQIQALERAQPVLPVFRNVPERQSTDYLRHGTTTLFAALDVLCGNVIGDCSAAHRSEDYVRFLRKVDKACPKGKVLHIVTDNLSTHKTRLVREYFASVPGRFAQHFTPTHSSWLNLVERWFAEITNKRIRRGSFTSVPELIAAIKDYIRAWNASGRSFSWTKKPDDILAKIRKAKSS
jgi:transposase/lambda repressor-like predicted transcriptional regulator